jgi:hypothetical protein
VAAGSSASSSGSLGNAGWGNLEAQNANTPESISYENRETVSIPEGMTVEQSVANIENAFQSYDNSVRYAPVSIGNRGNSNFRMMPMATWLRCWETAFPPLAP